MAINRANGSVTGKKNITSSGGNVVSTFKASGNHNIQPSTTEIDLLVIAGGGGGGAQGGGGGAGGFQNLTGQPVKAGDTIAVTVGAGGVGGYFGGPVPASDITPTSGANSVYSNPISPITSTGGGRGAGRLAPGGLAAAAGGSGGGGGSAGAAPGVSDAGAGTSGEGNAGGAGIGSDNVGGAGGGGAGAAGTAVPPGNGDGGNSTNQGNFGQRGGAGAPSTITGASTMYAGGGGGSGGTGDSTLYYSGGAGGEGGGGHGKSGSESPGIALAGATNTGSGGGSSTQPGDKASNAAKSEAGGSGLVVIKEKDKANGMFNMSSHFVSNSRGQWPDGKKYEISNSLRFNEADADELTFTPSSAGNRQKFTFSGWFKRSNPSNRSAMFRVAGSGDTELFEFIFHQNNYIMLGLATVNVIETDELYRDPAAWYHIVLAVDTTQATAAERVQLYVNGENTNHNGWDTTNLPNQNALYGVGRAGVEHTIGAAENGGDPFEGYIADVYFVDGQRLHCGHFGEPDPDNTSIWVPKRYYGTFGTNGFHLEFKQSGTSQNASGLGADTSGNANHFAANNLASVSQTTDTPSNNFCTYNFLATPASLSQFGTFSEGATTYTGHSNGSYGSTATGTMGMSTGKWYWESKLTTAVSNGVGTGVRDISQWDPDWANDSTFSHTDAGGDGGYGVNYNNGKPQRNNQESNDNNTSAVGQNDIVMHALDLDNGALYYGINGTWQASSDPESGASKTNAQHSFTVAGVYSPAAYSYSSRAFATNFGNPSFAISSGNADAAGYGNFEYAPPTGYFSICTKNLATYG